MSFEEGHAQGRKEGHNSLFPTPPSRGDALSSSIFFTIFQLLFLTKNSIFSNLRAGTISKEGSILSRRGNSGQGPKGGASGADAPARVKLEGQLLKMPHSSHAPNGDHRRHGDRTAATQDDEAHTRSPSKSMNEDSFQAHGGLGSGCLAVIL